MLFKNVGIEEPVLEPAHTVPSSWELCRMAKRLGPKGRDAAVRSHSSCQS